MIGGMQHEFQRIIIMKMLEAPLYFDSLWGFSSNYELSFVSPQPCQTSLRSEPARRQTTVEIYTTNIITTPLDIPTSECLLSDDTIIPAGG